MPVQISEYIYYMYFILPPNRDAMIYLLDDELCKVLNKIQQKQFNQHEVMYITSSLQIIIHVYIMKI